MTHIKKLVMQGFKSFPQKTEIPFDKGINIFVGPNGAGKSNISDALCFVLGRLSIKSIRAAKAKNLLFIGTKLVKPAREAFVEIIFDNSSHTFNLPQSEVSIKRIVRHNGQGTYKINGETKTRGEVIETLAQAGIDPYGFNIILQGQIQSIVKMHPEERRKIIEEVAGISIYELRKEKSLKELEKTEVRLGEIATVLRERTAFLRNLEKEREQALKYKELENTIKRCKASILQKKIDLKNVELNSVRKSIEEKSKLKDKAKQKAQEIQNKIDSLNNKISQINKHIQKSTGLEQETLHETITNLKAELEGHRVRKENYENRKSEIETRMEQMQSSIPEYESEIQQLRTKSPLIAKKQDELTKKKSELGFLEEQRKKIYTFKTELNSLKERLKDKESQLARVNAESDSAMNQIEEYSEKLKFNNYEECEKSINKLKNNIKSQRKAKALGSFDNEELESIKIISSAETQIKSAEKIKNQIDQIDICPLCQSEMTEKHVEHVTQSCTMEIKDAKKIMSEANNKIKKIRQEKKTLENEINNFDRILVTAEKELPNHRLIVDKQEYVKKLVEQEKLLRKEIKSLSSKREFLETKTSDFSNIEQQYSAKIREIEEISSRTEKDLDTTLLYKERELDRIKDIIKTSQRDLEEIELEIQDISSSIENKTLLLENKEDEERKLNEKFKQLFTERDSFQENIQKQSFNLSEFQNEWRQIEDQINYLKIGNAKLGAEKEALAMDIKEFSGIELIKASINILGERLQKAQNTMQLIGSINLRALEVYKDIKGEYDKVKEKVDVLENEKQEVLKIIEEIDKKKKRTFMKTFNGVNELFTRNYLNLSSKGQAFLELQNEQDIFEGGIDIGIKMQKGKYFDVTSLSGGEQTLVALALLFAVQEHKPYHFYIFDEIDASLDKRNSERLASLLRKYIGAGQYILITHNDSLITDSKVLYGVTMHEGVSKILSLRLD